MKFTVSWLKEYLDFNNTTEELVEALIQAGIEVESVENYQDKLKDFSVAYIKEAEQHPNADKLRVCKVETVEGELQIVCGAPNARAGIYVIYAPIGTYIPGTGITLKEANIRGIASVGMMLSERELAISDEHDAIIEFKKEELEKAIEIGHSATDILGLNDIVLDISITPNRGDLLGIYGIAKDLATMGFGKLKELNFKSTKIKSTDNKSVTLEIDKEISSKFIIRRIDNVKNTESPKWLKQRLKLVGLNPKSALVDITNYVMFSLNQPLHCYDRNKVKTNNNQYALKVELSKNQKFKALDQNEYQLSNIIPLVIINNDIEGLGGIMGGLGSACDSFTSSVLLEAAHFDNKKIVFAKRELGINSDASYRFEREIDYYNINNAITMASDLILEICGGEIIEEAIFENEKEINKITVNLSYINQLTSLNLSTNHLENIFKQLNYTFTKNQDTFTITPPSNRNDINHKSVIVAEIIRVYGINNLPEFDLQKIPRTFQKAYDDITERLIVTKKSLAKEGMLETINMSFISSSLAKLFNIFNEKLEITNPISEDLAIMRQSIIPSLVKVAHSNINKSYSNLALFEVGKVYWDNNSEENMVAGLLCGSMYDKNWHCESRNYDVWDIKRIVYSLMEDINFKPDNLALNTTDLPKYYHSGKAVNLCIGKNIIGSIGEIHPLVLKELNIKMPIFTFEIFLDRIPFAKSKSTSKGVLVLPEIMPVKRDFSFILNKQVKAIEVIKLIKSVDKKTITSVDISDVYEGENIPQETKSLSVSVSLQAYEKTFGEIEIQNTCNAIIKIISQKLKGELRTS